MDYFSEKVILENSTQSQRESNIAYQYPPRKRILNSQQIEILFFGDFSSDNQIFK